MIPVVRFAPGVTLSRPPAPAGVRILSALDQAALHLAQDIIVTCADGLHPPTDPHTTGEAYDVRVRDLTPGAVLALRGFLLGVLGPLFTVLYEVPTPPHAPELASIAFVNVGASAAHLHIQRRKGTTYPPPDVDG